MKTRTTFGDEKRIGKLRFLMRNFPHWKVVMRDFRIAKVWKSASQIQHWDNEVWLAM